MRQLCKGNAPQPKQVEKKAYHTRNIDTQKTMNMGQVLTLIEASRETPSSYPIIPIPDYICCSTYGRPRTKDFHWRHYKKLLEDNGLPRRSPAIYWLPSTFFHTNNLHIDYFHFGNSSLRISSPNRTVVHPPRQGHVLRDAQMGISFLYDSIMPVS